MLETSSARGLTPISILRLNHLTLDYLQVTLYNYPDLVYNAAKGVTTMQDMLLLETCERCGANLALMESVSYPDHRLCLVKRCIRCFEHPVEEVVQITAPSDPTAKIKLLQYESLRKHFNALTTALLGDDYYNTAMDVYQCDAECCHEIAHRHGKKVYKRFQHELSIAEGANENKP